MLQSQSRRRGFTLVELLVVISIIGVLMSLLLPAVQSAREAGRRTQCLNNLSNLGKAVQSHMTANKERLPTGGWGPRWVGYPDGGSGNNQPGGWVYNLLPYMEGTALHDYGIGSSMAADGNTIINKQLSITLAYMNCPSRRGGQTYQFDATNLTPYNPLPVTSTSASPATLTVTNVAKGDYAANSGIRWDKNSSTETEAQYGCELTGAGGTTAGSEFPSTYASGKSGVAFNSAHRWTGVIFQRSTVASGHIKDGLSKTYLFGEKFIDRQHYDDGNAPGDKGSVLSAMNSDNYRTTYVKPMSTALGADEPGSPIDTSIPTMVNDREDQAGVNRCVFGSPHAGIVQFAFCDGSTRTVSVSIDGLTHRYLGDKSDNRVLDDSMIGQ